MVHFARVSACRKRRHLTSQRVIQNLLNSKLTEARLRAPSYSLRAFAKKLTLSPSTVSEVIAGKRFVSRKLAEKIVTKLCLDPIDAADVLKHFSDKRSPIVHEEIKYTQLGMDHFRVISDWYHFAILSLAETKGYRHNAKWISKRFELKLNEVKAALERLERLEMLVAEDDGTLSRSGVNYTTPDEIADLSLRKVHSQNLELAKTSLDHDAVNKRDFTAITMAVDPKKIPIAKKMIRDFQDQLSAVLESGDRTEVYKLCMQLIPLTKTGSEK
jgi:uncharacterized protein (TIGR02147 family)